MNKKLRDITIEDFIKICKKYCCEDCPLSPYLGFDCSEFRGLEEETLEKEIEVPDIE